MAAYSVTAEDINRYIARTHPNAPLAGQGGLFIRAGRATGINPIFLLGIAQRESEYGETSGRWVNNPMGYGVNSGNPRLYRSASWYEGIVKAAKAIATGSPYRGLNTPSQIMETYAPRSDGNDTPGYVAGISDVMADFGMDGNASVRGWRPGANARSTRVRNPGEEVAGAVAGAAGDVATGVEFTGLASSADNQSITGITPSVATPGRINILPGTLNYLNNFAAKSQDALMLGQDYHTTDLDDPIGLSGKLGMQVIPPKVKYGKIIRGKPEDVARRTTTPPGQQRAGANQPRLTMGGGPGGGTHSRSEGGYEWQDDDAFDLMGTDGARIHAPLAGVVTRISGQPGGDPRFAGYGITIRTKQGSFFFKHLGTKNVEVGDRVSVGDLIGTLDGTVDGGPHLHLGATNIPALRRVVRYYTHPSSGGRPQAQQRRAQRTSTGGGGAPRPGGNWGGSEGPAREMARIAARSGLTIVSAKRDRKGTSTGGISDHWTGKTNAYAVDLGWGTDQPTHASDVAASRIVRTLGGPRNWGLRGGVFNTTVNGLRYNIIYRSNVGGDHFNHIHVGIQRV